MTLEAPAVIVALRPNNLKDRESLEAWATKPDGTIERLIWLRDYRTAWTRDYRLRTPLRSALRSSHRVGATSTCRLKAPAEGMTKGKFDELDGVRLDLSSMRVFDRLLRCRIETGMSAPLRGIDPGLRRRALFLTRANGAAGRGTVPRRVTQQSHRRLRC